MKGKTTIGKLRASALAGQRLHPDLELNIGDLDRILDDLRPLLPEDDWGVLKLVIDEYVMLAAPRGHPLGPSYELNRAEQCAVMLFEIGKQEYRKAHQLERVRRKDLQHLIARRAITVMEQKFPEQLGKITPDDVIDYNGRPTLTDDDFAECFPEARTQMRDLPPPSRRG